MVECQEEAGVVYFLYKVDLRAQGETQLSYTFKHNTHTYTHIPLYRNAKLKSTKHAVYEQK